MRSSEKIIGGWGRNWHKKLGKCRYCSLWNQSRTWISETGALSGESMGRSGSKIDEFARRIGNESWTLPGKSRKKLTSNESVAKKQIEPDNWEWMSCQCNRRGILLLSVSFWLKFRIYKARWIPWPMQEIFFDLETGSSSGASHIPSQPLIVSSPRGMLSRDSGLPLDTRKNMVTSGNVFESQPAREGPSSAFFENSKNLASSSSNLGPRNSMEHGKGVRRDPQSSSTPTPRFDQGLGTLNSLYLVGGTYSQFGVMDYPRYPISELHLGKFTDSFEFQSWNVYFKTEKCANSVLPQVTMHWVKELEIAKPTDDLVTSPSITGRRDFTDYDRLDTMIASALQKLPTRALPKKS